MNATPISDGQYVEVTYILREEGPQGEELEVCGADDPFGFIVGNDEVLPAFEAVMRGLQQGDTFMFRLTVDEAYGPEDEEAFVELPKSAFLVDGELDESVFAEGEVVPMETEDGEEVLGIVTEVRLNSVVVDFNHPFAGLDLHFEGQVVRVGEAPPSLN